MAVGIAERALNAAQRQMMNDSRLSERIANELLKRIHGGELPPHTHLIVQKLADGFRVSRSPVREALQILARKGLLEQRAHRGFFVRANIQVPAPSVDVADRSDAPTKYFRFAEDWLRNEIPPDVTEQYLRDRYDLTKGQVVDLLTRAANEGWVERKDGYGWRMIGVAKTSAALEQIYRFRASIEPAALLEPTFELNRRAVAEQRSVQEGLLSGNIERLSADRLMLTGAIFHEELVRMSGNSFSFQAVVRANRMRRLLDYRTVVARARFYDQAREHLQMLDLLERGENLECSYLLKRHLVGALASKTDLTDIPRNPAELTSL